MTQAPPRRVLFVCRNNQRRSATAERLFAGDPALDVRSAGTGPAALVRVNALMLDWADIVFIMDGHQRTALTRMFPGHPALDRLVCLDIEDHYRFLQPELVAMLRERVGRHLGAAGDPAREAAGNERSGRRPVQS